MTEADVETEVLESYRPSLVKLTSDLEAMERELLDGLDSRAQALDWIQRLTIRTLGELPQKWYRELGRQFQGVPSSGKERTLLSAMLCERERERDICDESAKQLRSRLVALTVRPAYHRAYRKLRKDAGEYVDSKDDSVSGHSPEIQRFIAMRPAIDELETYQQRAMDQCIDGFDERDEILDWGRDVELATHGEISETFVARCYREESTSSILRSDRPADRRARECFVANHLIPQYNRGVRDLAGRAKEQPDDQQAADNDAPDW